LNSLETAVPECKNCNKDLKQEEFIAFIGGAFINYRNHFNNLIEDQIRSSEQIVELAEFLKTDLAVFMINLSKSLIKNIDMCRIVSEATKFLADSLKTNKFLKILDYGTILSQYRLQYDVW